MELNETAITTTTGGTHTFAYYKAKNYKVNLMLSEGEVYCDPLSVTYGHYVSEAVNAVALPDAPEGKEFDCWSVSPTSSEPFVGTMPAHDVTLYLRWKDIDVTVTTIGYDKDGNATDDPAEYGQKTEAYGTALRQFGLVTPKFTEPGVSFVGWQEAGGTKRWYNYDEVTMDINLEPITKDQHVASPIYVFNGGSLKDGESIPGTTSVTESVDDGNGGTTEATLTDRVQDAASYMQGAQAVVKAGSALEKNGKAFAAWNTQADGKGTDYYPGDLVKLSKNPVTLYARYVESREVTLVYHLNEGTKFNPAVITDDSAYVVNVTEHFNGSDETIVEVRFEEYDRSVDYSTLPNKYPNVDYPASTDNNGVAFLPFRSGYSFLGWNTDQDATTATIQSTDTIRVNPLDADSDDQVHLYAVWELSPYICQITDGMVLCCLLTEQMQLWTLRWKPELLFRNARRPADYCM